MSTRLARDAPGLCNLLSSRSVFRRSLRRFSITSTSLQSHWTANDKLIFSGIQPTGVPHIGNYLGALQQWVRIQNSEPASAKLVISIVDLHAITVQQDAAQLRRWKRETLAALLAVGLDPKYCTIFFQSDVSFDASLLDGNQGC